jgi:hypothetical protein
MGRALQAPRYQELLEENQGTKYGTAEEFAQIEYLGELLADRAAQNLPRVVRNNLHRWGEGVEAQQQLLRLVEQSIKAKRWKSYGQRAHKRARYGTRYSTLPAMTKSWERGPTQPNCLGVAQMLVGFARLVGAKHYFVSVLNSSEKHYYQIFLKCIDATLMQLQNFKNNPEAKRLVRNMNRERERVLVQLGKMQQQEAHHALLIQLADGSWCLLDPYFSFAQQLQISPYRLTKYFSVIETDKARNVLLAHAHSKAASPYYDRIRNHEISLIFIRIHQERLRKNKKQLSPDDIDSTAHAMAQYSLGLSDKELDFNLKNASEQARKDFMHAFNRMMECAYLPPLVRKRAENNVRHGGKGISNEQFEQYVSAVRRDRIRYTRAYQRLMRCIIQLMLDEVNRYSLDKDACMHDLIEVQHPTVSLACATLNHQRAKSRIHLHGRLVHYTSSYWILHDTLAAELAGDVPDASSGKVINKRIKRFLRNDAELQLEPLVPLIRGRM